MSAKTITGITFQQLHTLDNATLIEIIVANSIGQSRESLIAAGFPDEFMDQYLYKAHHLMQELFSEMIRDKSFEVMRKLYDTEERFNMTADLTEEMGNLSIRMQPMMQSLQEDCIRLLLKE